ncbi:BatD family protein [candidate division KSB1 bacterium]
MKKYTAKKKHISPHYCFRICSASVLLILCFGTPAHAFQTDTTQTWAISLSDTIDKTETPLNSPVTLIVTLSWQGRPDKYRIGVIENPALTNLETVSSTSSSRSEVIQGRIYTFKEFVYTLQPQELGMAYIDGLIIPYTETTQDISDNLATARLSVKITAPVFEKDYSYIWKWSIGAAGLILLIFLFMRLRRTRRSKAEQVQPVRPLEDIYFEKLSGVSKYNLSSYRQPLDEVITVFRKYLTDKFAIPVEKRTGQALSEFFYETGIDDTLIQKIDSILEEAEQLRFSGADITLEKFETMLGSVETCIRQCRNAATSAGSGTGAPSP